MDRLASANYPESLASTLPNEAYEYDAQDNRVNSSSGRAINPAYIHTYIHTYTYTYTYTYTHNPYIICIIWGQAETGC